MKRRLDESIDLTIYKSAYSYFTNNIIGQGEIVSQLVPQLLNTCRRYPIFFLVGPETTGKSTTVDACCSVLGDWGGCKCLEYDGERMGKGNSFSSNLHLEQDIEHSLLFKPRHIIVFFKHANCADNRLFNYVNHILSQDHMVQKYQSANIRLYQFFEYVSDEMTLPKDLFFYTSKSEREYAQGRIYQEFDWIHRHGGFDDVKDSILPYHELSVKWRAQILHRLLDEAGFINKKIKQWWIEHDYVMNTKLIVLIDLLKSLGKIDMSLLLYPKLLLLTEVLTKDVCLYILIILLLVYK
jgi:hypothetical protein